MSVFFLCLRRKKIIQTKKNLMYNILKNLENRNKIDINDETVVSFLNGEYESDLYGELLKGKRLKGKKVKNKQLQGIRAIDVSYWHNDVDIFFAKQYQEGVPVYRHKGGLKPFVWAKYPDMDNFFKYNFIELNSNNVSDEYVLLPHENSTRRIDGKNVKILKTEGEGDDKTYYVRYKILSEEHWDYVVDTKANLYGISIERQITTFGDSEVDRMKAGFKYKYSIKNRGRDYTQSDNPFFKNKRIKGSFNNLLSFFHEGGVAHRGTLYLDEDKLVDVIERLRVADVNKLNLLYLSMYRWRKRFNPFSNESVDWDKIVGIWKKKHPSIAYKINKNYINKEVDKDFEKFFNKLVDSKEYSDDIFNVQLDKDKIVKYIVDCFTFDGNRELKELVEYLEAQEIDFYREIPVQMFYVQPREQYMIQTGRRLFKGIDNYEDLDILTFDIETTAQLKNKHMEAAALFPEYGRVFQVGIGDNHGYVEILHAKKEHEEKNILVRTYEIIAEKDPDIILTYNGEGFDFPFIEKRLELLGCVAEEKKSKNKTAAQFIRNIMKSYFKKYDRENYDSPFYRRNDGAIVKVGGATEEYTQTSMIGRSCCDVMFSVKRAAAIDTSIPNFKLKDNMIHANLAAKNRVYVKGDMIGFMEADERPYYYNAQTGDYFVSKKGVEFSRDDYKENLIFEGADGNLFYGDKNILYMYEDSSENESIIKECVNTFPISIKFKKDKVYYDESQLKLYYKNIDNLFEGFYEKVLAYDGIVCPVVLNGKKLGIKALQGIKCIQLLAHYKSKFVIVREHMENVQKIHNRLIESGYIKTTGGNVAKDYDKKGYEFKLEDVKDWSNYETVSGSYLVQKYLEDDVDEPYRLDKLYSQSTFEICKWLPTSYERVATMGNANVWKLILATWSYINCIGIPDYEPARNFTGGLVGMVESGFHENIVKIDYSSLYPAEFLQHVETPDIDITGIYKQLVKFGLYTRLDYKKKKNQAKAIGDAEKEQYYDKKQLPLKILINSFYGMLGAPKVSPFCHINSAWHITCSGRQHMRHLIHYFAPLGFKIIYFHTDGANFVIPKDVKKYTYVGKGLNWLVEKGVKYEGVEAYVAEYNDMFMRGRMGVDIDEYCISCINFAKANFSYLKEKRGKLKISHVGGTLVNKRQSAYIKTFLNNSLINLFNGDGFQYVEDYYDYIRKINNLDLIAGEICSKAKVKKSLKDYQKHVKDGGNMQAHMELAIMHDLDVNVGDWIYYVNIGKNLKEEGDLVTHNDSIGYFSFDSKEKRDNFKKSFSKKIDDKEYLKNIIIKYNNEYKHMKDLLEDDNNLTSVNRIISNGYFTFKNEMVKINDPSSKAKSEKISKKHMLENISDVDEVKLKMVKKQLKNKPIQWCIEIVFANRYLNVELVNKEQMHAKVKYNAAKYIKKFNKAVESLLIVFNSDVRVKIPTPNRKSITGEDYDRNASQRGWFLDEELEVISGQPLKGKESKQQELEDLLLLTDEEMELWELLGMSPNNSFDYKKINYEEKYYVNDEGHITTKCEAGFTLMSGSMLADWLKDQIILDESNPPYKFLDY